MIAGAGHCDIKNTFLFLNRAIVRAAMDKFRNERLRLVIGKPYLKSKFFIQQMLMIEIEFLLQKGKYHDWKFKTFCGMNRHNTNRSAIATDIGLRFLLFRIIKVFNALDKIEETGKSALIGRSGLCQKFLKICDLLFRLRAGLQRCKNSCLRINFLDKECRASSSSLAR